MAERPVWGADPDEWTRKGDAMAIHSQHTSPPPTCQYCLADPRHTPLGPDPDKRCPVCGAAYTGPRRSAEYALLVEAGLVAKER